MVTYNVTIRNARAILDELSLDREGFTLIQHNIPSADDGREDDPEITCHKHLEEMASFIKQFFNASWVVPRKKGAIVHSASGSSIPAVTKPGEPARIDCAPIASPMLAALENQAQGIPIGSYSRLMIIHSWRALFPPPQACALAICDAATVLDTDFVVLDYTSDAGAPYKSCILNYNPRECWYYFPEMKPNELILFKGYDSEENCNARTAHAVFQNRREYLNAKLRRSMQASFFVYYA
ncbi:hypothetical protein IVA91_29300 [Bradyrhizobium sp. 153]|nr:hypothetical protein [Bradyrhizobium sp. 153]